MEDSRSKKLNIAATSPKILTVKRCSFSYIVVRVVDAE